MFFISDKLASLTFGVVFPTYFFCLPLRSFASIAYHYFLCLLDLQSSNFVYIIFPDYFNISQSDSLLSCTKISTSFTLVSEKIIRADGGWRQRERERIIK